MMPKREITPAQVRELFPLAYVDDLVAGFHFPNDGRVNPADVAQALAKGARQRGVKIVEHCAMTGLITENGRAVGVHTEHGDIRAEVVVLCPGMWGRELGLMTGLNLPLQAAEHYYLISEPIEGLHNKLPILRDPGRAAYAREEAGKILLGFFERDAGRFHTVGHLDARHGARLAKRRSFHLPCHRRAFDPVHAAKPDPHGLVIASFAGQGHDPALYQLWRFVVAGFRPWLWHDFGTDAQDRADAAGTE